MGLKDKHKHFQFHSFKIMFMSTLYKKKVIFMQMLRKHIHF